MKSFTFQSRGRWACKFVNICVVLTFLSSLIFSPVLGYAQVTPKPVLNLPQPGEMVRLTHRFDPVIIKGMTFHPENPLEFDFIIHTGDMRLSQEDLKKESNKLVKYFLASLTVPEEEMWVNLSPYENDRIIPQAFGYTEMGRDLLAQDYLLKQLSASLIYPEKEIGEEFWDNVYAKAYKKYGRTVTIPVNTFNKIWVVPKDAVVAEKGHDVFVLNKHLKVMLERDYVALQNSLDIEDFGLESLPEEDVEELSEVSVDVIREILIPAVEKEVNTGKNFAPLRQIYNSMILATWFKKNLKESLLGQVYVDQNKVKGVDVEDKQIKQKIYNQYVDAFKQGVYNYVKEDYDPTTQRIIPRKYFSGGAVGLNSQRDYVEVDFDDPAMTVSPEYRSLALRTNQDLVEAEARRALQRVSVNLLENTASRDFAMAVSPTRSTPRKADLLEEVRTLQRELENYRQVATVDHLSQLPNRRAFYNRALKNVKQIRDGTLGRRRSDNLLAVYTVDINEFKFFNELFGHDVGDEVLKGLGTLANSKVQGTHTFARVGGEEFYGAMPQAELEDVDAFVEELRGDLITEGALVFPSLNNPLIVKRAMDTKIDAISKDIVSAIDTAVERGELPRDFDKRQAVERAKRTGEFDVRYQSYLTEDVSKLKNGLVHQMVVQDITDENGNTLTADEWGQKSVFSLLDLAAQKMDKVFVTLSAGSTLLEKEEITQNTDPQEALVRLMNEADVAMYRSKEMKNQSMRTIRFDAAEPDMVDLKGPMDIEAGVNQIQETLITTQQEVPIVTDFQEMSVDQIQEYRNTVQTEIDQMRRIAEVDVVAGPGVYNSRGLENQLGNMVTQMRKLHRARDSLDPDERRVARADRRQRLQYVSIDLGDLKIFNDIFGHAQGDKLINVFAQTAKNVVDEYGAVARYGGDEFAILLQGTPRNATTTLEQIHSALLDVDAFQIPQGALRSELDNLSGDAREKFLRAVRRQIVLQRDQLQQQGRTVDIETLMDDSQLENIPMDILSEWKPVFSSGVASYDASIMGDWSAEAVQKTLSLASDRAQEESKSQMRTTGSFITYTAEELGINKATVRRQEDYAITTAFNRRVTDHFTKLYPSIKRRTDQDLNMFPPTVQHRASLNNIVEQLKQKGVLQDGLDIYADVWTDIHDTGYRGREVDFDDPRFKRTLKMTWQTIGEAVGLKPEAVRQMSDQAYEMFSNYADPQADFVGNLFINKILGHGSIGMAMNTQELMDQGVREKEALGMAMLAAAHHPGFPINFVEDTVLPSMGRELPDTRQSPMLPILLIDMEKDFRTLVMADYIDAKMKNKELTDINRLRELYETGEGQAIIDNVAQATRVPQQELSDLFTVNGKRDTISKIAWRTKIPQQQVAQDLRSRRQASANYLRMKLADYVADNLGIMDRANARMHALLGYGLDRITPANPGTLRRNPNTGVVESQGGEIVDKKYGLVASTNITSYERLNLDTVYTRAVENVEQERNAFINAVEDMKSGLDAQGVALLDELKEGIVSEGDALITKTRYNQQQAVAFVNQHLRNSASIPFSGHLRDIDMDIAIVENIVQQDDFQEEFTPEEQAGASYLLRSLKALRTEQIKKRVDQLRKTVSDLNLSRNLPAETTLSPEEVLQQWTLIGGEEKEVTYVLDTLNTMPMEERLDILLQGLREKAQQEESDIILDRADHLMRVAHYSIEQAQRDGENRRKILEAARRAYSDYVETRKQTTNVGGINLNASLLDLQIKRDGKGIPLPAVKQPIHNMKIDGFLPVIIDIAPIQNVPFFISMNDEGTQTDA